MTTDDVIIALIAFVQPFVPSGLPIIRGQINRTSMPQGEFVKIIEIHRNNLDTPTQLQDLVLQQTSISNSKQLDVQIDFYGMNSGDWSATVESVWRAPYGPDQFPAGIAPLYCSDARQMPLVTGEEQYLNRWVLTGSLEYNPNVIVPQQSATSLKMNLIEDLA